MAGISSHRRETITRSVARDVQAEVEWLRELFQQAPGAVAVLRGPQHVFEMVNPAYLQLIGRQGVVGKAVAEALPEIREQGFLELLDRVYRSGEPHIGRSVAVWLQRHPGSKREKRIVDFVYQPIRDAGGAVTGIFVQVMDVTDRQHADEVRAHLAAIVESSSDAIVSKTLEGRVTSWNAAAERVFGYEAREMIGESILRIIPPDLWGEEERIIEQLRRGERVEHYETERLRKDGRRIAVSITVSPVRDSSGRIIGASKVARDISERKRAELALQESERRLRLVADHLPALISYIDRDGYYHFANAAYEQWFGIPPADVVGRHTRDIFSEEVLRQRSPYIEAALRGELTRFEGPVVHRDLGTRICDISFVPDHDSQGVVNGFYVMGQDITERKRVEEELREQTLILEILNHLGKVVAAELDVRRAVQVVTDAATRLSRAAFGAFFHHPDNPHAEEYGLYTLSGAPREAFAGFPAVRKTDVFAPTLSNKEVVRSDDITRDPRYGMNPPYRGMPAGHLPVRSYLAVPVISRTGEVLGGLILGHPEPGVFTEKAERLVMGIASYAAVAIDNAQLYEAARKEITERKRAEEALREADRRKDEFLATLAHELRNPLAPIRNAVQILKAPGLSEAQRQWSQGVIDRQVQQMARLLDDLLDVSRITRGTLELRKERLPIHAVVESAVEIARPLIDAKGHALEIDLPDAPILLNADPVRMTQILGNLLTNAAKYTDAGGRIRVRVTREGAELVVCVQDNGIGLGAEQLSRLFEMFSQAPEAISRSEGGLGVGLAITKGLVELHGGRIEAHSDGPGKGSEFIVRLPVLEA